MYKKSSKFTNKEYSQHYYKWKKKKTSNSKYRTEGLKIYKPTELGTNYYTELDFQEIKYGKARKE